MSKFKTKKGDKIIARSSSVRSENEPYEKIGGHIQYQQPLTVTKTFNHGVRTAEKGYIHNNNILENLSKPTEE